ncbi:MAG: hypothetical protein RJB66_1460 [Pseudomonadota bacterium]
MDSLFRQFIENWQFIWGQFRWQDAIDLLLVWFLVYRLLLLIRKTGAVQILSGLGLLAIFYILSLHFGLYTFNWLLDKFFAHLFLIVVILFQSEIRRVLAQLGSQSFLNGVSTVQETHVIEEIVKGIMGTAQKGFGALVVIERDISVDYHIESGTEMDSRVSSEIIESVFHPTSPVHDGAMVIRNSRILSVGCFLPLSKNPILDRNLGTRHRAALGLTEETDALVLVVSEESRSVGIVQAGHLIPNVDAVELRRTIYEFLGLKYKGVVA